MGDIRAQMNFQPFTAALHLSITSYTSFTSLEWYSAMPPTGNHHSADEELPGALIDESSQPVVGQELRPSPPYLILCHVACVAVVPPVRVLPAGRCAKHMSTHTLKASDIPDPARTRRCSVLQLQPSIFDIVAHPGIHTAHVKLDGSVRPGWQRIALGRFIHQNRVNAGVCRAAQNSGNTK